MIKVYVSANPEDASVFFSLGNELQRHFHFQDTPDSADVTVELTEVARQGLFSASPERGVRVSTWQSEGISRYSEKPRDLYLLSCALLGLVYWRALILNPLLRIEDFIVHEGRSGCLFSARETVQEYALAFEKPYVCKGCVEFYRCLGAEEEIAALLRVIKQMTRQEQLAKSL